MPIELGQSKGSVKGLQLKLRGFRQCPNRAKEKCLHKIRLSVFLRGGLLNGKVKEKTHGPKISALRRNQIV